MHLMSDVFSELRLDRSAWLADRPSLLRFHQHDESWDFQMPYQLAVHVSAMC
jgi:hypothetical protein